MNRDKAISLADAPGLPAASMASLKTFEHRFDANIQFISPEYAGYYIVSTFQYYAREILK